LFGAWDLAEDPLQEIADQRRRRQREKPGPDDAFDDAPFHAAETFHRANAHDGSGNHVGGGKRDAVIARDLDDNGGARLSGESVDRLKLDHFVTKRANDSPAPRCRAGSHGGGAKNDDPFRDNEIRGIQEMKDRWQVFENAALRPGEKREGDDAHGLLRVVRPVAVRHPRGADQLQFAENGMDEMRRERAQNKKQQAHQNRTEQEPDHRRREHRHDDFRGEAAAPFQDRPIAVRGGERRAAQAADERVAGTGRQPEPPRDEIPDDRAEKRAQHGLHVDDLRVDNALADGGGDGGAHERSGEIKKCRHRDRLARREDFRRDDGRNCVRGVVKAVDVFERDGREHHDDEQDHAASVWLRIRSASGPPAK